MMNSIEEIIKMATFFKFTKLITLEQVSIDWDYLTLNRSKPVQGFGEYCEFLKRQGWTIL